MLDGRPWYVDPRIGDKIVSSDGGGLEVVGRLERRLVVRKDNGSLFEITLDRWREWGDVHRARIEYYGT